MAQELQVPVVDPKAVEGELEAALLAPPGEAWVYLRRSEHRRQEAARVLAQRQDRVGLACLRLKESVLFLMEEMPTQALTAAHEAWKLADGRLAGEIQALILTQLAACFELRGDLRSALRAVRRAEALVVAACGEDIPQVLVVRAQLVRLLEARHQDAGCARTRLIRTFRRLEQKVRDLEGRRRHERLREVFVDGDDSPPWALVFHRHWRDVYL